MRVSSRRRPDQAPPIGRDVHAARLAQMIDDAAAGAKRAALLLGAPGIGKTTLLRYAHGRAIDRGCLSVLVRVPATAGLPPRFPLGEVLEGLVRASEQCGLDVPDRLRRVADALTRASSVDGYTVSLPQIADAFEECGRSATIAIFVDDYQWAPPEGTELMMAALRIIETPLFFLATARLRGPGEEPTTMLPEPTSDLWIDHIEVRGLDLDAVGKVAAAELDGEILPSLAETLTGRTLGNPLFVRENVQAWRAQGVLVQTGGYWGVTEEAALVEARSLREMIATRFSGLDDDARGVAIVLAIIGHETGFDEVAAATGMSPDRLVAVLSLLVNDGLVIAEGESEPSYRIVHPLYASSLIETIGSTRAAVVHGRVCEELRRRADSGHPVLASELAHHAVRALHAPPDLRDLLVAAAEEAEAAGSDEEAAIWYGLIAERTDDPKELVRALTGQASAVCQSDPQRSVQLFTYALQLESSQSARARLLLGRARAHRTAGMVDLALEDLGNAFPIADQQDRFDIRHLMGSCHGMQGRTQEAEEIFADLAATSAGTRQYYKALGHLGVVKYWRGDIVDAVALQEEALRNTNDAAYAMFLRTNLTWMLFLVGRWKDSERYSTEALRDAIAKGSIADEANLCGTIARFAAWGGDLGRAFDAGRRALRLATRLSNPSDMIDAYGALAIAFIENDMPEEAAAMLPDVTALDQRGIEPREFSLSYTAFAEAAVLSGDLAGARTAIERARGHLADAPFWEIAAARVEAQLRIAMGDPLGALDILGPWFVAPTTIVFEHARVLETVASARAIIGDRAGAQEAAEGGLRLYESFGARPRADRLRAWLEEHRVRKPGRPRSTLPGNLTQRENEVLRLVVLGGSNRDIAERLFISIGTVKKHLENLMAKAGASRRQELLSFAISIGALAVEELRENAVAPGRIVDLTRFERVRTN